MKEFIEKLIARLEEQRGHICNCMPCNGCKYIGDCNEGEFAEDVALDKAIEIVNELAEEYNNVFCEWKEDGVYYHTCKGEKYICDTIDDFEYCPCCGKKIKVV